MIAIAWVDTPTGRHWAAFRGLVLMLVGVIVYNTSEPGMWEPIFLWLGRGLLLFGALGVAWAYLHASRGGIPLSPLSVACTSNRHIQCAGTTRGDRPCGCHCHIGRHGGTQAL
jgi:hypothetical protein